jgi:hypothetical protein
MRGDDLPLFRPPGHQVPRKRAKRQGLAAATLALGGVIVLASAAAVAWFAVLRTQPTLPPNAHAPAPALPGLSSGSGESVTTRPTPPRIPR